jgi:hypothetical protein
MFIRTLLQKEEKESEMSVHHTDGNKRREKSSNQIGE